MEPPTTNDRRASTRHNAGVTRRLRLCVVGPGAVGGVIAAALQRGGSDVSVLGRAGPQLEAVRAEGLRVTGSALGLPDEVLRVPVSDDPADLPTPDVVVLAVKTTGLAAAVRAAAPLLGPDVAVLPAVNGMPWWFLESAGAPDVLAGRRLRSLDPTGVLSALVPATRVIGGVVHWAASVPAPGVVEHASGNRLVVGDAGGALGDRVDGVAGALRAGGLVVDVCATPEALREQVWIKLLGNMSFNPVSALTGGTLAGIARDPAVSRLCTDMITECLAVGSALGVHADISPAARVAMAVELGEVRTSMLQDAEAGRELELDAMPGVVSELGGLLGIATPATDAVLGLLRMRERVVRENRR